MSPIVIVGTLSHLKRSGFRQSLGSHPESFHSSQVVVDPSRPALELTALLAFIATHVPKNLPKISLG